MLAWQADSKRAVAGRWILLGEGRGDAGRPRGARRSIGASRSKKRSATQAEVKGVLDAARSVEAQAAAQGAVAAGQSAMEHELEELRRQVAALRLRSGESLGGDDMAAARDAGGASRGAPSRPRCSKQPRGRGIKTRGQTCEIAAQAALRAEASRLLAQDARRQLENTLDSARRRWPEVPPDLMETTTARPRPSIKPWPSWWATSTAREMRVRSAQTGREADRRTRGSPRRSWNSNWKR